MITRIAGTLVTRELDRVEIMTQGGVCYEIAIPLTAYEKLPKVGKQVELRTHQVVRDDGIFLFGFGGEGEKALFMKLLTASGIGPRLALAMLSSIPAPRLIRAIREKDIATLSGVSGVGKRTAERLAVDLANKLDDIPIATESRPEGAGVDEALRALAALGYQTADAERAVRAAAKEGHDDVQALIKDALGRL